MIDVAPRRGPFLIVALLLGAVAGTSALAVSGWAMHGEAIFLKLADGAWLTCL